MVCSVIQKRVVILPVLGICLLCHWVGSVKVYLIRLSWFSVPGLPCAHSFLSFELATYQVTAELQLRKHDVYLLCLVIALTKSKMASPPRP